MKSNATRANPFAGSVVKGQIWVAREFRWRPPRGDGDLSSGGIGSGGARQHGSKSFFPCGLWFGGEEIREQFLPTHSFCHLQHGLENIKGKIGNISGGPRRSSITPCFFNFHITLDHFHGRLQTSLFLLFHLYIFDNFTSQISHQLVFHAHISHVHLLLG